MEDHPILFFLYDVHDSINNYLTLSKEASELSRTVLKYVEARKNKSRSKTALILKPFGSVKGLHEKCIEHNSDLLNKKKFIVRSINELERIIDEKGHSCPRCMGGGSISKSHYVRDKGSTRQRTIKMIKCPECNGVGKIIININEESKYLLKGFLEILRDFDNILDNSIKCVSNLHECLRGDYL